MKLERGIPIVGLFLLCLRCVQSKVYKEWGMVKEREQPMVMDGEKVKDPSSYPWHVAIYRQTALRGGGSIISERYVLTVTHVTYYDGQELQPTNLTVKAGLINLKKMVKPLYVTEIIRYPGYDKTTLLNDICLLKLADKIIYSNTIRPVKLWSNPKKVDSVRIEKLKQTVVGFGLTRDSNHSDDLMRADVIRRENSDCSNSVEQFKSLLDLNRNFCALGNATVCSGDSGGGSAYFSEGRQRYYLTGLVSQGITQGETCAPAKEVLYTKIEYYSKWIEKSAIPMEYNLLGISDCSASTENEKSQPVLQGLVNLKYAFRKSLFISDCHGVLITRKHVLTQASCVGNNSIRKLHAVAVGSSAINSHFEPSQQYTIQETKVDNEIAIITLAKEVDQSIKPMCLPTKLENGVPNIAFWKREVNHPKLTQFHNLTLATPLDQIEKGHLPRMDLRNVDKDNERLGGSPWLYTVAAPSGSHVYLRALEKCPIEGCGHARGASFIDILSYVERIRDNLTNYIGNEWLYPPLDDLGNQTITKTQP